MNKRIQQAAASSIAYDAYWFSKHPHRRAQLQPRIHGAFGPFERLADDVGIHGTYITMDGDRLIRLGVGGGLLATSGRLLPDDTPEIGLLYVEYDVPAPAFRWRRLSSREIEERGLRESTPFAKLAHWEPELTADHDWDRQPQRSKDRPMPATTVERLSQEAMCCIKAARAGDFAWFFAPAEERVQARSVMTGGPS